MVPVKFSKQDISDIKSFANNFFLSYPNHPRLEGPDPTELSTDQLRIVAIYEAVLLFLNKNGFSITIPDGDCRAELITPKLTDKYRNY